MRLADRFAAKVSPEPNTGCHLWTAGVNACGYGTFRVGAGSQLAHRVAWSLEHGGLPPGAQVLHSCDQPCCVAVAHLRLGTHAENMADMSRKGRSRSGHTGRTHCVRGHPLAGDNVYLRENGWRTCRQCARILGARRVRRAA